MSDCACSGVCFLLFLGTTPPPPDYKYHVLAKETISHCEAFINFYKLITHTRIICLNTSTKVVCSTDDVDHIDQSVHSNTYCICCFLLYSEF